MNKGQQANYSFTVVHGSRWSLFICVCVLAFVRFGCEQNAICNDVYNRLQPAVLKTGACRNHYEVTIVAEDRIMAICAGCFDKTRSCSSVSTWTTLLKQDVKRGYIY